jgi:hypothetical protein
MSSLNYFVLAISVLYIFIWGYATGYTVSLRIVTDTVLGKRKPAKFYLLTVSLIASAFWIVYVLISPFMRMRKPSKPPTAKIPVA